LSQSGFPHVTWCLSQARWVAAHCTQARAGVPTGYDELHGANDRDNVLPKPPLDLCLAVADAGEGAPLFPAGKGSLPPAAVARTIVRAHETSEERPHSRFGIAQWSAHDLRRTALTGMARLGVAPIVLGHVANHRTTTRAGVTLAVYSQYTYATEKRAALDLWADRLSAIVGGTGLKVAPLKRKAAR
jgi:integrase